MAAKPQNAWLNFFSPETVKENEAMALKQAEADKDKLTDADKAKDLNANIYAASLGSGDAPPTGASDAYGPSALALANENLNSPEVLEYITKLEKSQQQAIDNQKAGIASAQGNVDLFNKQPVQYDLSPLMNLSDSWFGSNLAKGYKAPTTPEEAISAKASLEGALNKARMGLTEAEKDRLQQNLTNRQKTAQILNDAAIADLKRKELGNADKDRLGMKEENQKFARIKEFHTGYGTHVDGLTQMRSSLQNMKNILKKYGGQTPDPINNAEDYGVFNAELSKTLTRYNTDLAKLGALSGSDLDMLKKALNADPNYLTTWIKEKTLGKSMNKAIDNLIGDTDKAAGRIKSYTRSFEKVIPEEYRGVFSAYDAAKGEDSKIPALLDSMKGL